MYIYSQSAIRDGIVTNGHDDVVINERDLSKYKNIGLFCRRAL